MINKKPSLKSVLSNLVKNRSTQQHLLAPPGRQTQLKDIKNKSSYKKSAVLILFFPNKSQWSFVLMKRTLDSSPHSGQISIPGGKKQFFDLRLKKTALREYEEEMGLSVKNVVVTATLTDIYIPVSNFVIRPFVGYLLKKPTFYPDPKEVDSLIFIRLSELFSLPIITKKVAQKNGNIEVPGYSIQGHFVWGATAMILSDLIGRVQK